MKIDYELKELDTLFEVLRIREDYLNAATIDRIRIRFREMKHALDQLSECNFTEDNCAGLDVASARVRNVANLGLGVLRSRRFSHESENRKDTK